MEMGQNYQSSQMVGFALKPVGDTSAWCFAVFSNQLLNWLYIFIQEYLSSKTGVIGILGCFRQ